jgi:hypothetical protein
VVQAFQSILEIYANPQRPLALFPRIMKIGSQIKGQETKQKIEATHNGQLPKKLILTRKLTLLSERNAVF